MSGYVSAEERRELLARRAERQMIAFGCWCGGWPMALTALTVWRA